MRTGIRLATLLSTSLAFLTACSDDSTGGYWEENPSQSGSTASTPRANPHAGGPHAGGAVGMQNSGAPAGQGGMLVGKAIETMDSDSGTYTYVKLEMPNGETEWAAVPATQIEVGRYVAISQPVKQTNFPTKTKMGTFEELILGGGLQVLDEGAAKHIASGGADVSNPHGGAGMVNPHGGAGMGANPHGAASGPALEVQPGEIERPEGTLSVAEVFAQAQSLKGQPVAVHGKITKATPLRGGVWTHIQDGSGDPAKADHDLTVVLQETPELGSVVTIKGTLQIGHEMAMGAQAQQPILDMAVIQ